MIFQLPSTGNLSSENGIKVPDICMDLIALPYDLLHSAGSCLRLVMTVVSRLRKSSLSPASGEVRKKMMVNGKTNTMYWKIYILIPHTKK